MRLARWCPMRSLARKKVSRLPLPTHETPGKDRGQPPGGGWISHPRARAPRSFDLTHERGVDDQVAEGLDELEVCLTKQPSRLHVDAHLRAEATVALRYPGQMQHAVDRAVRDL